MVQIVTNASDLQAYAAEQVLIKLRAGSAHESMLKIAGACGRTAPPCSPTRLTGTRNAGYLLGEFGHLLPTGPAEYFGLLQQRFPACSLPTQALLLSADAKARACAAAARNA